MRNCVLILALVLSCLISCKEQCGREPVIPNVLRAVPSDALAVGVFRSCDACLGHMTDSTDVFAQLPLGQLGSHPAAYSYKYAGSLISLLSIDLLELSDTSQCIRALMSTLPSKGLESKAVTLPSGRVILISRSSALIKETYDHIVSGTSILSSNGFTEQLGTEDAIYVRNSTLAPLARAEFSENRTLGRSVASFLTKASEWIALEKFTPESCELRASCSDDASFAVNIFKGLHGGDMLFPYRDSSLFCADLAMADWKEYRLRYESWLDSRNALTELRAEKVWAERFCPVEVVKYVWAGGEILLARPEKPCADSEIRENTEKTYLSSLFGGIFRLSDESCCASAGGWLVIGSRAALEEYLKTKTTDAAALRGTSLYLRMENHGALCIDTRRVTLNVY